MKRLGPLGLLLLLGVLAGRASADPITLAWDANPESDHVLGYVVYIGTDSANYTQRIDVGNTLSYVFPDAVAGQAYYFAVVAYSDGPLYGWLSSEVYGWSNAPPFLTNPGDRTDVVGTAIAPLQLQAFDPYGQPVSYSANGLPPGLTLQESTGLINGTPTDIGAYPVEVTALDPSVPPLTDTKAFEWLITPVPPAVVVTPDPASVGVPLSALVMNDPIVPTDWLGWFQEGADDRTFLAWCYLNGTKAPPATGVESATVSCFTPTAPGRYQARLFASNGFAREAVSNTITVPGPAITLTPNPAIVGTVVTAGVTAPGNPRDWIGFFPEGAADTGFVDWCYLNGTKMPPTTAVINGTVTCFAPTIPGRYQARLFSNNTFSKVASSNTITLLAHPTLSIGGVTTAEGQSGTTDFVFTVSMNPANTVPVTVEYTTADRTAVANSDYLATSGTLTFAPGVTSQTFTVQVIGDTTFEPAETFAALLSNPSDVNTTISVAEATATIVNDDATPAPTVVLTPDPGTIGNPLTATVTLAPGNTTDWLGYFAEGAADNTYVAWCYLNGAKTAPVSPVVGGAVSCFTPSTSGRYQVRLFSNNSFTKVATSNTITVDAPHPLPGAAVALTPDPATPGSTLSAAVTGAPGHATDWMGLFLEGAGDNAFAAWCYLNGTRTAPASPVINGTVTCFAPTNPGRYQVRLFSNNTFTKVATSNTITVASGTGPSLTLSPDPAATGTTLTVGVTGGPGNATDWLGLYQETAGDTSFIDWCYLDGSKTKPQTGTANATVTCFTPALGGRYQVRLFSNLTFTKVMTSNTITVP